LNTGRKAGWGELPSTLRGHDGRRRGTITAYHPENFVTHHPFAAALLLITLVHPLHGQVAEQIDRGIVRFHASDAAQRGMPPSFALVKPLESQGPAPAEFPVKVSFSKSDGKAAAMVPIAAGTSLYGTGCVTGPFLRNGQKVITWNTDAYGYAYPAASLYQSHPWVLAVRADGTAYGVLADTTWRTTIDLTDGIRFIADGPDFPVTVIERATPLEVVTALATLTGTMEMPPKWAIGYHQCRYSYYPESRVREIAKGFRDRKIPCDVIWHDIDYMRGFRCFTFDPQHFPDPKKLNSDLHAQGFRTVWMIDPGIKAEPGYFVYDQGLEKNAWVQRADGSVYQGEVWPGMCVFPDFLRRQTRQWWGTLYRDFMATGIDGVWNDMNEPAVFNVPSKTMPEDNLHRADEELGGPGPHARYHNVYGMMMVRASRDGVLAVNPDKRPFVLTRANYIGGQRYSAMWTGDNTADWQHLEESVSMVLNMGLSGQPFAGPDIGGFAGNGPAGQEGKLFARWMGVGAMLPFSRGHTGKGNIDKEPWSFGPQVEETCRLALERRYRLLPYLYTLFHFAHTEGAPIVRPVFFADPKDPALRSEDDAFLLGSSVMVVPQMVPDGTRAPALPRATGEKNGWTRFDFGDTNPDLPELYLRSGSIIPTGPVMQHTSESTLTEVTLVVCLNENGEAKGVLYEDAGEGWGFRAGEYLKTAFRAERKGDSVVISITATQGSMKPWGDSPRTIRVRVLGEPEAKIVQDESVQRAWPR
jgi:alpha-glucosidase